MIFRYFLSLYGLYRQPSWWCTLKYNNFKFRWNPQFIFSIVACTFGVISKKTNSRSTKFYSLFLKRFMVLFLTFRSLIHFGLIFGCDLYRAFFCYCHNHDKMIIIVIQLFVYKYAPFIVSELMNIVPVSSLFWESKYLLGTAFMKSACGFEYFILKVHRKI